MSTTPPRDTKPYVSDSKQAAPRQLLLWVVPLAVVAVIVVLVGMHFLSGMK